MTQDAAPRHDEDRRIDRRAPLRLGIMLAAGVVAGIVSALVGIGAAAPVIGWDVACVVYVGSTWLALRHLDEDEETRLHATQEDPSRRTADVLLITASIVSLAAVAISLVEAQSGGTLEKALAPALAVVSVALSWLLIHTLYTLNYARLYYTDPEGGIDFNMEELPQYSDFAYLAFTVGMTFQVSDTDISSRVIRSQILKHMLLSYLFGSVIVATTVNLVAGMSTSS